MKKSILAALCIAPIFVIAGNADDKAQISLEEAIKQSDDFPARKSVFLNAAENLMADFRCKRTDLEENGGFVRSSSASNRYFTYCRNYKRIDLTIASDTEYELKEKGGKARSYSYANEASSSDDEVSAKIAELEEKVRPIPASDFSANLDLYRQLLALDPSNERYIEKVTHYEAMDARDEAKHACANAEEGFNHEFVQACRKQITDWLTHNTAKNVVKRTLNSPRSAKFSNYRTQFVKSGPANCDYLVAVDVDAQNSFGAMIRQSMRVSVTINPNTKLGTGVVTE